MEEPRGTSTRGFFRGCTATTLNGGIDSKQIHATQRVALDLDRTVQENTDRYWPLTRGKIYFKPGTSPEILWEAKRLWENDYRRGLTSLPPNVRFQV
eukprot:2885195-Pyramimonas_sp.AAC.1